MLACKCENIDQLHYPLLASPKIDGIRCLMMKLTGTNDMFKEPNPCLAVGRSLKAIPNRHIQNMLGYWPAILGFDGELVTYTNGVVDTYNQAQSKIMSQAGEPEFIYHVFDQFTLGDLPYTTRYAVMAKFLDLPPYISLLPHVIIKDSKQLAEYEMDCLNAGHEGCMTRHLQGGYKFGRSTWRQQWLTKIKRFLDAEATVIGFEEKMTNTNEQTINELGLAERSSHKANQIPAGTLGALVCNGHNNVTFKIGTGFDDATRQAIWNTQEQHLGAIVKYKYQPHGIKEAPRMPVFLGWRD